MNGLSVIWGGDYSSTKTYHKNQAVFYNGSSYRANKVTTEEPSIDALDWDLLAQGADASNIDLDNYYTIEEVDTLLDDKANQSTTYTKIETDNLLNLKPSSLSQLSDVQITSLTHGQLLYFDDVGSGKWINQTVSIGDGGGSGETNTASNVGLGGVGLYKQKTGSNLEFKNINAASNKITITNDTTNSEVDIDVNEANLTLGNLAGTLAIAKGGTGSTSASAALTALGGATIASVALKAETTALTSHTGSTSNPHSVTASQVGSSTAQWNASKIQSVDVISTAPTNGQILTYNSTSTKWEPTTFAASGGKVVQVVYASSNTITTVAAGSYTSIGLTASITPTVVSNILYVFVEIQGIEKSSGTADTNYIIGTQLYNTTSSSATYTANCFGGRFTTGYIPPISFQTQAAITATTMNFAVRANVTGGSIRFQSNNTISNIIIMEITL